jgi:hypothetical protein
MRHLRQPTNLAYVVAEHVSGANIWLVRHPDGSASFGFIMGGKGDGPDGTYRAAHRGIDELTAMQLHDGKWAKIRSPIFDPTWSGIEDWMRYGIDGRPADASPSPGPSAVHVAEPTQIPEIAAVTAMGVAYYHVFDGGAGSCENGDPGHRVHLVAWRDPQSHPLTDATIDLTTQMLCEVRFGVHQSGVLGVTGDIALDLGTEHDLSVVESEQFDLTVRVLGFAAKRVVATANYTDFATPTTLDPAIVTTQ